MSFAGFLFKTLAAKGDAKRDSTLTEPQDVTAVKNIDYVGKQDFYNLLDVYYPQGTKEKLPVIVSVHGGGYVYGTNGDLQVLRDVSGAAGLCVCKF